MFFTRCRQLGVVGARAGSRPLLCERTLAASVGKYRRVVVADAAEEAIDRLTHGRGAALDVGGEGN